MIAADVALAALVVKLKAKKQEMKKDNNPMSKDIMAGIGEAIIIADNMIDEIQSTDKDENDRNSKPWKEVFFG